MGIVSLLAFAGKIAKPLIKAGAVALSIKEVADLFDDTSYTSDQARELAEVAIIADKVSSGRATKAEDRKSVV